MGEQRSVRWAAVWVLVAALAACDTSAGTGRDVSPDVSPRASAGVSGDVPTSSARPTAIASPTPGPTDSPGGETSPPATRPPSPSGSAPGPPPGLLGHVVTRLPTSSRVVALTFDAGANADGVGSILATLKAKGVPASFFLTGRFVDVQPDAARRMAAAGRVGNHTTTHPHLPTLPDDQVRAELRGARATILTTTGQDPQPWFRFPYGSSTPHTVALVNSLGYVAVGWTVDTLGWEGTSGEITADVVVDRVVAARVPGMIVLMHVGSNPEDHSTLDADALPRIIDGLRSSGYSFVTLDAMLR